MERKWPLGDLDSAQFRLKCAVDALGAIHTAIEEGPSTAESYTDALYGILDYLHGLSDEISDCVQACLDEKKQEKAGAA